MLDGDVFCGETFMPQNMLRCPIACTTPSCPVVQLGAAGDYRLFSPLPLGVRSEAYPFSKVLNPLFFGGVTQNCLLGRYIIFTYAFCLERQSWCSFPPTSGRSSKAWFGGRHCEPSTP